MGDSGVSTATSACRGVMGCGGGYARWGKAHFGYVDKENMCMLIVDEDAYKIPVRLLVFIFVSKYRRGIYLDGE